MKNLLLVATFAVAGVMGTLSAKSTVVKSNKSVFADTARKCYDKKTDAFGNVYYVQVKCPDVIVP